MKKARTTIIVVGILCPYLVRLPRGLDWLAQYTGTEMAAGLEGFMFISVFNAIAWGSLIALSFLYQRVESLAIPSVLGFGFLAWAHFNLDLRSDAQASVALVFIPIYASVVIVAGGLLGWFYDRTVASRA